LSISISLSPGLYREAQFEGLSAGGGTIRLWRYSTVGNRPKFPYTSYTFTGKLDLGDVHLAGVHLTGMYLSNVYLIGVYLIGVQPIGVHLMA
jgi:hypothetical protein